MFETQKKEGPDRAITVGAYTGREALDPDLLLDELDSLVSAAGGEVVGRTVQRRGAGERGVSPATFVGRGKAEHVAELVKAHEATVVVFDNELSPAQVRELEKVVGCRVIDRSELILDIFASRARTREARLQVELAQLQYTAPRLRGMWSHLERQAGGSGAGGSVGIGTRGPGEKQIEIDRRIVSRRLTRLRAELGTIHGRREREVQKRGGRHFTVGLVGYTNAGKSTMMNAVTRAGTYSADQLFATLDTKTRSWHVGEGVEVMLSDTVGFVRDLPHQLVASFRATLEEALSADLLIHVIDASHPQATQQIETVESVLAELGCETGRILCALNKIDRIEDPDALVLLRARLPEAVPISAATGAGLDRLEKAVYARYRAGCAEVHIDAPLDSGRLQAFVRARGSIEDESYDDERWRARVVLPPALVTRLRELCPEARVDPE